MSIEDRLKSAREKKERPDNNSLHVEAKELRCSIDAQLTYLEGGHAHPTLTRDQMLDKLDDAIYRLAKRCWRLSGGVTYCGYQDADDPGAPRCCIEARTRQERLHLA